MKNTTKLALSVFSLALGLGAGDLRVLSDLSAPAARYKVIVGPIGEEDFLNEASVALGSKDVRLGELSSYENVEDQIVAGSQDLNECSYGGKQLLLESYRKTRGHSVCPVVREAMKIGSSLVYRSLDRRCNLTAKVLRGQNPLGFVANGQEVEVLEVRFRPALSAPALPLKYTPPIAANVFVRTKGAPSVETAKAVFDHLREATGMRAMTILLRSDTWFFFVCDFPAWFPFEPFAGMPTKGDFQHSHGSSCSGLYGSEVRCQRD